MKTTFITIQMDNCYTEITNKCPICDKVEINSKWYEPHKAPIHEIIYTHKKCPTCFNKKPIKISTTIIIRKYSLFDPI
jgi:endogenous inhibitor of DNA gyrase (YacG/DUF329 family)